jgi:hypothetical protein
VQAPPPLPVKPATTAPGARLPRRHGGAARPLSKRWRLTPRFRDRGKLSRPRQTCFQGRTSHMPSIPLRPLFGLRDRFTSIRGRRLKRLKCANTGQSRRRYAAPSLSARFCKKSHPMSADQAHEYFPTLDDPRVDLMSGICPCERPLRVAKAASVAAESATIEARHASICLHRPSSYPGRQRP